MSSVKIVLSEKGKQLIVLNGFKYRFHKSLKNNDKRWMCCGQTREKCKAFLKTQGDNVVTEIRDEHNHRELNEDALNRQMLSNSLKRKTVEDIGERPMKILQKELRNGDVSTLTTKDVALQVEKCNKKLALRTVFADFEEAIQQSVTEVWTNVSLKGCRFHLGQSWWRKIQALGLTSLYKDKESDVGKYLTYCFGMPFLNPEDVGDCFVEALSSIQPQNHRIVEFADYLVDNYVSESKFPPEIWAEMSSSLQRTTNACESFHSKFNSSFYFAHPHFFQFLTVLIDFQSETYVKIRSVQKKVKKNYSAQTLTSKKFVDEQILKLNNRLISKFDYLKSVGKKFRIVK
ncbi:uncharacterized protein LOC126891793 [Diabrotica virgifera virgifera]|uniref:FLYWCH-type domain-containing protein n=1 Tax=Diabrotica virgifera virgifera TaxID=50390 RepID=A0ABM5L3M0_DIAVI|nr:uncharacterized protein LOC126891793 [Diabrotica virgifera virgifera]